MLTSETVFGASLSPDASKVAVGCADNTVRIVESASGKELLKMTSHENWVLGTIFGMDGKRIVSVGRDQAAKLSDAASGAFIENVNLLRGELAAVARHPSRDQILIGGAERVPYLYTMDRGASSVSTGTGTNSRTSLPDFASYTRTLPSNPPAATCRLSALKATA